VVDVLTDQEKATLKTAAFGAVTLVSVASPGAISTPKTNMAGAKVLSGATGLTGQVINGKPYPKLPSGSTADTAAVVLPALTESVNILQAKAPDEVDNFRRIVTIAVEQGASSSGGGINAAEAEMISKVKQALEASA
jgi:hypothetical protein